MGISYHSCSARKLTGKSTEALEYTYGESWLCHNCAASPLMSHHATRLHLPHAETDGVGLWASVSSGTEANAYREVGVFME